MSAIEPTDPPTREEEPTDPTTREDVEEADGDDAPKEEESTANFEPVIKLEEVEVRSGEEDEDVMLSVRTKLFIHGETMLDKGTGKKSWVERGVGDIRLLKHREQGTIRVLMRQEKTMKVIVNHQLDPRIALTPNVSSDRSWVWVAYDFADGESLVETTFACRFKDSTVANEFKADFEKYQNEMTKFFEGADAADSSAGDEAAAALANLTTKDDTTDEAEDKPSEE